MPTGIAAKTIGVERAVIMDIIKAVIRKIWLVALMGVLCAALVFAYVRLSTPKNYAASLKMIVVTEEEHDDINALYQKWRPTTVDYGSIIVSRPVLEEVIDKMDLDMTPEELAGKITVNTDDKSTIIRVTVANRSGDAAVEMLNVYKDAFMRYIKEDVKVSLPVILEVSDHAEPMVTGKLSDSKKAALGFIVGVLLALIAIVLLEMYNEKIRDQKEAEECLKVRALADFSGKAAGQAEMLKGRIKILGDVSKTILFTAASPVGDKKTIITELSQKLASNGIKAAVIDLDRSDSAGPGTSDASGVSFIVPEKGANDLTEEELSGVLAEAGDTADIVLVNAPDMSTSVDAAVLGKYCEKAVLFIKKGKVKASDAVSMKEQLEESGCALAGTVIVK